ncbi:efflux RND transporter periplasmic adaptor subunit [Aquimarina algiphila]|uniref:efflux RND transporter periplasmic adaptor subunit n=1 Tax=Aquimarina algiphila TaxID=2047982 RepID=UPI00232E88D5|nr:efflux RND transporter periplasmic adaptor subunit [Aquimarina algiphila]
MKNNNKYVILILSIVMCMSGCKYISEKDEDSNVNNTAIENLEKNEKPSHNDKHGGGVLLNQEQVDILGIKIDTLIRRNMNGYVQVNGTLGVPPQNEAIVTSVLGANISNIKVIEGDKVSKGQVLTYISHPDIIGMQTDYLQAYNKLVFLEQDYNRQKKLYDEQVGSGRDYQQAKSIFSSTKGLVKGYESQLRLLGLSSKNIREGNISQVALIKSPIDGFIEKVKVKSGQYVEPQTPLFEIVNTDHIHADLMVFEKDISKVKNGQLVKINIEALGNTEMTAKIYSVGKSFEEGPKALHVHAEIENKNKNLIQGMYVTARIITENTLEQALPEGAIIQENETFYVFVAEKKDNNSWNFVPKEVIVKSTSNGFTIFDFKEKTSKGIRLAQSGSYYLMAEMKKSEAGHSH